ncbi:hypothetical protein ABIA30_004140 [Mycobacterium sp. MAA66]|uniref:hypothetical protein n=1 Tax=Mycobacterium sp. MAA66 TaxID=3156297 RepID=UPI0035139E80
MNITAALAADLRLLTAALDETGTDIAATLHQLAADTIAGVPSFLGLSVMVSRSDPLFASTYLVDGAGAGDVRTSLRLRLPGLGEHRSLSTVAIILYAGAPGTFVDLAADLAWLTARPLADFILDRHLTIPAGSITGGQLRAASTINQAIGILIGRGHTPQQANWELDIQARHARTDRLGAARHILALLTADVGDQDQPIH